MQTQTRQIACPVAIHRWFSGGEGWAYHPDLSGCIRDVVDALKPELENRQHRIEKRWLRGILFGSQIEDQECRDPQARGRAPTVLRIVSLPREPLPAARDALLRRLTELDALQPGQQSALRVLLSESELTEGAVAAGRRPWASWKGWVAIMALVSIVVMGMLFLGQQSREPRSAADKDVQQYFDQKVQSLLGKWRISLNEDKPAQRREEFFRQLSPASCSVDENEKHPDAMFWRRLKHTPGTLPEGSVTGFGVVAPLHRELKRLAGNVAIASHPVPVSKEDLAPDECREELPRLFEVIENGMDYRRWFAEQKWCQADPSSDASCFFPWDMKSPPQVRKRIVDHFLSKEQVGTELRKEDLLTMVSQLNAWGVMGVQKEDTEDRPWFVCDCYLTFLSQSRFGTIPEEPCWYKAFVARLPTSPAINMADRESKKDLRRDALLPLARGLGLEPSDVALTSTLLTDIADRLAYEGWRKQCDNQIEKLGRRLQDELMQAPPECKKKTEEYDIAPYGTVRIEVARDGQNTPTRKIDKETLDERSKSSSINDFVERFRPRGTARENETPSQ